MAELYLAKDTRSNRMLVLKRILPYLAQEAEFLAMFLDEARIAAQLHHPHIAEVFELGRLDGSTFISMEWIDGVDLRRVLRKEQEQESRIPPGIGAWLIARLCEGLHYAHQRADSDGKPLGIVHRDVSPQNVMVSYRGDVKLVDFGIAKATAWMRRSKPGVIKGKFLYLAPEQLSQERLDHRADLFALGTLLYELTVGKSPFLRPTTEGVIYSIRIEDPPVPRDEVPSYPEALSQIVLRCLEKDRERRYQSAEEVRLALDAFVRTQAPTTQEQVAQYIAIHFGSDDERTSVYVPPNAQTAVKRTPTRPGPPVPDEEEQTASIPRSAIDGPATQPMRANPQRDGQSTAPLDLDTETRPVETRSVDSGPTAPVEKLLVPAPKPKPGPPIADDVTQATAVREEQTVSVAVERAHQAPPARPPRPRRSNERRQAAFDLEDHIATLDMAKFEDEGIDRGKKRYVIAAFVVVALIALLAWAFWPRSVPIAVSAPRVPVRVTFRGPPGMALEIAETPLKAGDTVALSGSPVVVKYVCPATKKRAKRVLDFTAVIPEGAADVTVDVPPCP